MTTTTGPIAAATGAEARWSPLAVLADAAARGVADGQTVAVVRGFDRESRRRARTVRDHLAGAGVRAVEATPAPDSWPLGESSAVGAVVNVAGSGSWDAHRIAAQLAAPLYALDETGADGAEPGITERRMDLIDVRGERGDHDIALSHVTLLPEDLTEAELAVVVDGTRHVVRGAQLRTGLHEHLLRARVVGEGAEHVAAELTVEPVAGVFRLVRDGLPVDELTAPVTLVARPEALTVHLVRA
ncbi:hypothetical protein [Streptoalloteichus hindustanus]|uniref:Uncharacterized protein n=1 Tax=Streptoalloteichus hindustanus TaxID=2017 RepID=A0A1M5LUX4_STRHI|nr:hypothetical protein [Streptoalloteichus hindustanus]SHG68805.1 hypothetical protein SAMN05444320_11268 [Streptoalloteichus hindustanus]